jgi:hypothetical protein
MAVEDAFPPKSRRVQRVATTATIAFFAFVLGFSPLAAATILARLGEYEQARVAASDFYTDLQTEVDRAESGFAAASRGALRAI